MECSSREDVAFIAAWLMNECGMRRIAQRANARARTEKYSARPLFTARPHLQKAPAGIVSIVSLPDERKAA